MFQNRAELIETLWNVNAPVYVEGTSPITELIETLWNVNKDAGRNASGVEKELIETLWNVNIFVNLTNTCQCPN